MPEMTDRLVLALAQLNPTVGDVDGNARRVREARNQAAEAGADLVACPELVIAGYPPEDLVLKPAFQDATEAAVMALARDTGGGGPALLLGSPWRDEGALYNAVLLLADGVVKAVRFKHELPNYGVFDEKRVFAPGPLPGPVNFRGIRLGVMLCEDMWTPDVTECLQETGAEILIVGNGSPFDADKIETRLGLAVARVVESGLPLAYVNQVGGQDELVFEGASFVLNADRTLAVQAPAWREDVVLTRWNRNGNGWLCEAVPPSSLPGRIEAIYQAMVMGLRDYVNKNGFTGVVLGLSGGIDSALSAVVAADALGAARVHCLMLPSPYTSNASLEDAGAVAQGLGVALDTVSIGEAMRTFEHMLADLFAGRVPDTTEENLQARLRAVTLMALSNKFGTLLLTTGNKSEMSVGYATLYGDMSGGYSVLKDVYKTTVYELARWRNEHAPEGALGPAQRVIPESTLTKAPSAELKPDQTDQDTLPPYEELDDILECLVEGEMAAADIVKRGHAANVVAHVAKLLYRAEYKRRQAPPGVKITSRSFGRDRRYPITNGFRAEA
jgi:NAD+ synthase